MRPLAALILFSALSARAESKLDLQWSVCAPDAAAVAAQLGIGDAPKVGSVTYYDAIPVTYLDEGFTFRVKASHDDSYESSVKVRRSAVQDIVREGCEWDRYGDLRSYTCEVTGSDISYRNPWTKSQRKFADQESSIDWDSLREFGPYRTTTWKTEILGYKMHLDSVELPKGLQLLSEVSVKVPFSQGDDAYRLLDTEFRRRGLALCVLQEPKTLRLFQALGLKR